MTDPRPLRRRRWLLPALGVSVAINLAVLGVVLGALWTQGPERSAAPRPTTTGMSWLDALSHQDRAALRAAFRDGASDHRGMREQRRNQTAEIVALLRADPFDAPALAEALAQEAALRAERETMARGYLMQHLAGLTPEARAAYADRIEAAAERPRRGGGGRRGPDARGDDAPSPPE